jgi:8-oxo-dGTP diphosphatase
VTPGGDDALGVVVGAAILHPDGRRVLAAQRAEPRAHAGRWEFAGGKVEPGEDERCALRRECREELGVEVEPGERLGGDLPAAGGRLVLRVWWARLLEGEPQPVEHAALRWLGRRDLYRVEWLDADLPLVALLHEALAE